MRPELSAAIIRPGRLLNFLRFILAPFALGAITVSGFAPFQFFVVPPVTLTVLLLIWLRCQTIRMAAAVGFAFGAGLFLVGVSWVYVSLHVYGGMAIPVAALFTLLFCLIQACYPALACAMLQRLRTNAPVTLMLLFPALWAITEWMRSWILSGFPWLAIGYSQVPSSPLTGYAPLLGAFGVSLIAAAVAGGAASTLDGSLRRRSGTNSSGPSYGIMAGLCVAGALVVAGAILQTHQWTQPLPGAPTRVTLLQGNIPQELKWRPERALATLEAYLELARSADGKLVVLPETALPMLNIDLPPDYLKALSRRVVQNGGDMLYGVPELDPSGNYYNSVMSIGTAPAQTYRKHHLVPFGDYFPLRPVLGWIMNLLHIPMSDFSHGAPVQRPIQVAGQKVAVNICYEDAFGEEIIRQLPEATMLANFTNDAWWGDTIASRQHLQMAQMRALETGRPMLRATNTGITAIIDSSGRIVAAAPEFTATEISGEVRGYQGRTPYIVFGNAGFLVLALAMLLTPLAIGRAVRIR
ncbi:MAG TPA: apolipoprotein N-acyltransferase [Burkholderiales bacterium]|nr:apolipoprotein N-acyltransferase [Burkholderiales bacterium]